MIQTQRHTIRLPKPLIQLKLPLLLMLITLSFGMLTAWHTHAAYERIYATTMSTVGPAFHENVQEQTADFLVASGALLGGYALTVLGLCIAYTHSLIGPTVALQRQARKLRAGDFTARTTLRKNDTVFVELARDLNAVSEMLEKNAGTAATANWRS